MINLRILYISFFDSCYFRPIALLHMQILRFVLILPRRNCIKIKFDKKWKELTHSYIDTLTMRRPNLNGGEYFPVYNIHVLLMTFFMSFQSLSSFVLLLISLVSDYFYLCSHYCIRQYRQHLHAIYMLQRYVLNFFISYS